MAQKATKTTVEAPETVWNAVESALAMFQGDWDTVGDRHEFTYNDVNAVIQAVKARESEAVDFTESELSMLYETTAHFMWNYDDTTNLNNVKRFEFRIRDAELGR